jgi:hypothetical protein
VIAKTPKSEQKTNYHLGDAQHGQNGASSMKVVDLNRTLAAPGSNALNPYAPKKAKG